MCIRDRHLSDIHTGRHAQRIQHDIQRTSVRQERHIFHRKDTGNHTLVTVTAGHLISHGDLTFLSNIYTNRFIYGRSKLVAVFSGKYFGIHNDTVSAVRHTKRCITNFSCLLTEDCTKQSLLCGKLCLSLRSYLTYKDISGLNFSADTDDSVIFQILLYIFA